MQNSRFVQSTILLYDKGENDELFDVPQGFHSTVRIGLPLRYEPIIYLLFAVVKRFFKLF